MPYEQPAIQTVSGNAGSALQNEVEINYRKWRTKSIKTIRNAVTESDWALFFSKVNPSPGDEKRNDYDQKVTAQLKRSNKVVII